MWSFISARRDWKEEVVHNIWYENRPLGVNTLGSMMKEITIKAMLSKVYTNHCVRATAITSEAGLSDRHICHISGHRNPNSLQHYNSRPLSTQLKNAAMFYHLLYKAPARQRRYLLDISILLIS